MKRILTGIQSTGVPHLGNILGAIIPAIKLSKEKIRQQMRSLKYEEISLLRKKKPVFTLGQINRMATLVKKSLSQVPKNKHCKNLFFFQTPPNMLSLIINYTPTDRCH